MNCTQIWRGSASRLWLPVALTFKVGGPRLDARGPPKPLPPPTARSSARVRVAGPLHARTDAFAAAPVHHGHRFPLGSRCRRPPSRAAPGRTIARRAPQSSMMCAPARQRASDKWDGTAPAQGWQGRTSPLGRLSRSGHPSPRVMPATEPRQAPVAFEDSLLLIPSTAPSRPSETSFLGIGP